MTDWPTGLCVGIDPEEDWIAAYPLQIIDATAEHAVAYKLNLWSWLAWIELHNLEGRNVLGMAIDEAADRGRPVILDAKMGDVPHIVEHQAQWAQAIHVQAVTFRPYRFTADAADPFLKRGVDVFALGFAQTGWHHVLPADNADLLTRISTFRILHAAEHMLIPGIGAQGGDLADAVHAARDRFLINVSRGITDGGTADSARARARAYAEEIAEAVATTPPYPTSDPFA